MYIMHIMSVDCPNVYSSVVPTVAVGNLDCFIVARAIVDPRITEIFIEKLTLQACNSTLPEVTGVTGASKMSLD